MLAVEKWSQDKHFFIALFAPQIAAFAREIPDIIRHQKKHRLLAHTFLVPNLLTWYAFYRSSKQYLTPFKDMISEGSQYAQKLLELGTTMKYLARKPEMLEGLNITPESLKEGKQVLNDLLKLSFADLRDDFDNIPLSPEIRKVVQGYKDNYDAELVYLFLVAFPCWLLYKEWPSMLYHKARKGDANSIHKLLRLDPFLLHDPAIGREIQKIRIHGRHSVYAGLLIAPLSPIKIKVTSRSIKDILAGLISQLAESIKHPLTSTEIRDLFDAVAQDTDKQDIDTSLPESQEAYSKVIQRNRPDWKPLLHPGQKKLK